MQIELLGLVILCLFSYMHVIHFMFIVCLKMHIEVYNVQDLMIAMQLVAADDCNAVSSSLSITCGLITS
jgi:hypothetical protein